MKYTRQLDFYETPNYDYLRQLFASVMTRNDWSFDWVFDWTSRSQARCCVLSVSRLLMRWLGSEWLACWIQAQKGRVQIAVTTLSGNSLRQTVHTHLPLFTKQQNW